MAQALRNRFNGNKQEVLEYVGRYGISEAMNKYGVSGYLAMRKWVTEETGDENYGINPKFTKLTPRAGESLFEEFLERFANWIVNTKAPLEAKVKEQDKTIKELRAQLQFYQKPEIEKVENKLITIMERCIN
jgi:predicted ATP-grasp superfamily ATP-dependent carboligase